MSYNIQEMSYATDNQSIYNTSLPFLSNSSSLLVNNIDNIQYSEQDNVSINFNTPLSANDMIRVDYTTNDNREQLIVSPSTKRASLFKYYGNETRFYHNQKIHVHISIKPKAKTFDPLDIDFNFIPKCYPYFSNVKKIREDTKNMLNDVTDEYINYLIFINSKQAVEVIRNSYTAVVTYAGSFPTVSYSMINMLTTTTGSFLPNSAIPPFIKEWVRYKTDLDLVNAVYIDVTTSPNTKKELGEMSITYKTNIANIKQLLDRFQQLYDNFDNLLCGNGKTDASFVRAGRSNPYPIQPRNSF